MCRGWGDAKRIRSTPGTSFTSASSCGKSHRAIVGGLIVIHNLSEQLNLLTTAGHRIRDIRQDVALRAHPLVAARIRYDAECAVVVTALDNRDVCLDRVGAAGDAKRKRDVIPRIDVNFGKRRSGRPLEQDRQRFQPLGPDDDVDEVTVGVLEQRLPFLLRNASGDRDERLATRLLAKDPKLTESRVQLVFGMLSDAARVDDDDVGIDSSVVASKPACSRSPAMRSESWKFI